MKRLMRDDVAMKAGALRKLDLSGVRIAPEKCVPAPDDRPDKPPC